MCPRVADDRTAFLVRDAVVQDLPHEPTEPMRNRADCLDMAEAAHKPSVEQLESIPAIR
jgi:hypothetical protein